MREGWEYILFEDGLEHAPKGKKIPSADYKETGLYPIVSQEDSLISGYWNNKEDVIHIEHPVVIFGDHTRILKYIDFDFVIGADGVKILSPQKSIRPKFLYYYLKWQNIPSLGYSRHYKLLKELSIPVPPLSEQQRIVSELDLLTSIIDKQKAQLKELDTLAQSIFYDMFGDPETQTIFTTKELSTITKSIGGGTPSKTHPEYWDGDIPWVSSKDMKCTYIGDSQIHITQAGVDNSSAKLLPIGTILLVTRSGILKHTLPVAITTAMVTVNQDLKALLVDNKLCGSIYLLYCLKAYAPYLLSQTKAVTVDSIDFSIFKKLPIPLPPLSPAILCSQDRGHREAEGRH